MTGWPVGLLWLWPVACHSTPLANHAFPALPKCANAGKRQERLPLRPFSSSLSGVPCAAILAWRRTDPDAAIGHAPAHHPRPLLRGYRVHTLLCRGSGLPVHFLVSPANCHDAPFARPLLELAVRLYRIRPRIIRLGAGYWGLQLIHWIHATLGAIAVVPWNPKRQKNRSCLPPTWTKEALGKRSSIERFFGRVFLFLCLQRPPYSGWSTIVRQVALTYTSSIVVGLAAWHAHRPDLIRSPKRVLAHLWEDSEL